MSDEISSALVSLIDLEALHHMRQNDVEVLQHPMSVADCVRAYVDTLNHEIRNATDEELEHVFAAPETSKSPHRLVIELDDAEYELLKTLARIEKVGIAAYASSVLHDELPQLMEYAEEFEVMDKEEGNTENR